MDSRKDSWHIEGTGVQALWLAAVRSNPCAWVALAGSLVATPRADKSVSWHPAGSGAPSGQ
jgi:hypothetical protein